MATTEDQAVDSLQSRKRAAPKRDEDEEASKRVAREGVNHRTSVSSEDDMSVQDSETSVFRPTSQDGQDEYVRYRKQSDMTEDDFDEHGVRLSKRSALLFTFSVLFCVAIFVFTFLPSPYLDADWRAFQRQACPQS